MAPPMSTAPMSISTHATTTLLLRILEHEEPGDEKGQPQHEKEEVHEDVSELEGVLDRAHLYAGATFQKKISSV